MVCQLSTSECQVEIVPHADFRNKHRWDMSWKIETLLSIPIYSMYWLTLAPEQLCRDISGPHRWCTRKYDGFLFMKGCHIWLWLFFSQKCVHLLTVYMDMSEEVRTGHVKNAISWHLSHMTNCLMIVVAFSYCFGVTSILLVASLAAVKKQNVSSA